MPSVPTRTAAKTAAAPQNAAQTGATAPVNGVVATMAKNGSEVALPADLMAELRNAAKDAAAKERPSVSKISLANHQMNYMGNDMPGRNMDVVILASVFRNVYYAGIYNSDNVVNPNCFALATDDDGMAPHENVEEPEHKTCEGCPQAEWGTAGGGTRRGKACKQSRRLILLPADAITDVKSATESEMAIMDVPVTSIKNWANLVNTLDTGSNIPVWAAVVNVAVVDDKKTQIKLVFTPVQPIKNADVLRAIMKRKDEALRIALTPWDETQTAKAQEEAKSPTRSKKF